jgi:hypothetical protein
MAACTALTSAMYALLGTTVQLLTPACNCICTARCCVHACTTAELGLRVQGNPGPQPVGIYPADTCTGRVQCHAPNIGAAAPHTRPAPRLAGRQRATTPHTHFSLWHTDAQNAHKTPDHRSSQHPLSYLETNPRRRPTSAAHRESSQNTRWQRATCVGGPCVSTAA